MEGLTGNPRMIVILKYFLITFAMLWMTGCAESPNNISKNYIDDPKYSSEECKEMRIKALEYDDQILGRMGTGLAFGVFLGPMGVPIAAENIRQQAQNRINKEDLFLRSAFKTLTLKNKKEVQKVLASEGYYNGLIDGLWGKGTLKAVRSFIYNHSKERKLSPPENSDQSNQIYSSILNLEYERKKLEAEKQQEEELKKKEEELRKKLEAEKQREEEERKKKEEAERNKKKIEAEKWRALMMAESVGYRNIKMYMSKKEVRNEADCIPTNKTKCYGLDNIKFSAVWTTMTDLQESVLTSLTLDLGPLDSYDWLSALKWRDADPENRNIFQNIRSILGKKYKLDFEFSERDITFFEIGETNVLRISFNNGQVYLELKKKVIDYSTKVRLFLTYTTKTKGQSYVDRYRPKKAKASDF